MVIDHDLFTFLVENKKGLDNSFIFIIGDHGFRRHNISKSNIGSIDNNNPMLIMSIPKELRTAENMAQLKENADKLQTQYDVRATLLDIVKYQPAVNFTDNKRKQIKGEHGNSFFRNYCICQFKQQEIDPNSTLSIEAGKAVIDKINERLEEVGLTDKCNLWKFDKVDANYGYHYYPFKETNSMKIIVAASWPYSEARFLAVVHRSPTGIFTTGKFTRIDSYGKRGKCSPGEDEKLCDCKKQ